VKALNYECHRQYLFDYIEQNDLTLRDFVDEINAVTSISALSHFLKRNKKGGFVARYSFRQDTWIEILTQMNLQNIEFEYLINLKLEADTVANFGPDSPGAQHFIHVKKLLRSSEKKTSDISKHTTRKGLLLANLYDLLPKKFKMSLLNEAVRLAEYSLAGQKRTSKLAKIDSIIIQLDD